tara:strand:- start:206 stop:1210 length:1005 start_codon:yes stop_codon:yes gene_type:complete
MKKINIIAEAGVNHNGKINLAKKLIKIASTAKADYIKFQFYKTNQLVSNHAKLAPYQKKSLKNSTSQLQLLKKYELSNSDIKYLLKYSKKKKIKFLCTPFDINSLKYLKSIGVNTFKIASPDLDNFPLLYALGKNLKKLFISTGMSSLKEIGTTLEFLKKIKINKNKICLLHCVSDYPAKDSELNLNAIKLIAKKYNVEVGYSDHSIGELASIVAVALGANVIEKHITLDKKMKGPDHTTSMNEKEFNNFVKKIRKTEIVMGKKLKKITKGESNNYKMIKRSVFLRRDVLKGQKFKISDFICLRPRNIMKSIDWEKVIDKNSKRNYKKGELIKI